MAEEDFLHRPPSVRAVGRIRVDAPTVNDLHELFHRERRLRSVALKEAIGTPDEIAARAARKRMDRVLSETHRTMDDLGVEWIEENPESTSQ